MIVGIGVDGIEIDRVRTALTRTPSLLHRLFTPGEQAACALGADRSRYEGLAARFAAKEAVAKALGTGIRGFAWLDIEVVSDAVGKPSIRLHGGADERAAVIGADRVHLSLSTARDLALAYAIAEGPGPAS